MPITTPPFPHMAQIPTLTFPVSWFLWSISLNGTPVPVLPFAAGACSRAPFLQRAPDPLLHYPHRAPVPVLQFPHWGAHSSAPFPISGTKFPLSLSLTRGPVPMLPFPQWGPCYRAPFPTLEPLIMCSLSDTGALDPVSLSQNRDLEIIGVFFYN